MISNGLRLLILQGACSTRPIIVGGWISVRYGHFVSAQHSRHIMYIDYFLETSPRARPTWAETRMCSQNNQTNSQKNCTHTSPMKWKYFLHWHEFTPNDFQMHQQSLDHSYCKRENSPTKLNNTESVMIVVARLSSSPTIWNFWHSDRTLATVDSTHRAILT
jgi:hypothetical protein